jgi:hypothetical protein
MAAWIPTDLGASLALWLRSDLGVSLSNPTSVMQWNDQSGSGDSNRNLVQSTVRNQPTLTVSDAEYNGQPSITFTSATTGSPAETFLQMAGAWSSAPTSPYTVIVVGNGAGTASQYQSLVGDATADNWYVATAYSNREDIVSVGGTYVSPTDATANPSILMNEFNDPNSTMRINSFVAEVTGQTAGASPLHQLCIGASGAGSAAFLNGKIVEILVVNRLLIPSELTSLLTYLSARYAIFVTGITPALGVVDTQPMFATISPMLYPKNPTFQTGYGLAYTQALASTRDTLINRAQQATLISLPGLGDPSQLPYLAHDRGLVQGPAEPNANFVLRLSNAFQSWLEAGSNPSILGQLHAYFFGMQPSVSGVLPELAIVGGSYPTVTTWQTQYIGDPIGTDPTLFTALPANFNWDGGSQPWRSWLVVYAHLAATALSGTGATVTAATASACFTQPGQNVSGVWVPATSGTPVNSPWITIGGLSGISSSNLQQWITFTGFSNAANNGTFQIVIIVSASSVVIANPNGVSTDSGGVWSIAMYPFLAPGPVWGASGYVFGQGEVVTPAIDTGSNVGGVWQPSRQNTGGTSIAWGLASPCTALSAPLPTPAVISSIRSILGNPQKGWKSAGSYFNKIVVCFGGSTGAPGSEYSPNSSIGGGNPGLSISQPTGMFSGQGQNEAGVWVPVGLLSSQYDAYCQGSGTCNNCSVENIS